MKIDIKGVIVPNDDAWIYEWIGWDHVAPKHVAEAIAGAEEGEALDVYINSPGGDVFSGSEIYSALREYEGDVNIHIVGLAASAASVIAMAGRSDMSPTAQMMVHNVSMRSSGDYHDMDKASEILQTANRALASAYCLKSGMSEDEVLALMDKETWLTAGEAVNYGLVDKVTMAEPVKLAAAYGAGLLPEKMINEYQARRNDLKARILKLKLKGGTEE